MKSAAKTAFALLVLALCASTVRAQVQVTHRFVNNNSLEVLFLKDFDINSPASGPPIFIVDIRNDAVPRLVTLRLSIESSTQGNLLQGETDRFPLAANEFLSLTSNDLFSNVGPHRLVRSQVAEDVVKELLQDVLATGKLPSGVYRFRVEITDVNQTPLGQEIFDIRVSNPRKLDLIFPGHPVSRRADCEEIHTALPQFRWESDLRIFQVIVAELRRGEDPENALNQDPRFVRVFVLETGGKPISLPNNLDLAGRVERLPATSFQFPPSGEILTFRPGRTYVWRVIGVVNTSSGPFQVKSEIFCFRIARLDEIGTGREQFDFILRSLLGSDYDKLFGEGGEFEGYRPKRLYLNGAEITPAELFTRLPKLKGKYSGYRVE
ncbi:MAG: hypothetical protein D6743_00490 [Calditrichaeota bacterium]|nr:MAG: hypothetical protein D6743_00490 [Calditrichota bacterium]